LNDDLQQRLNNINETTTTNSTRQQLRQHQPTTLDIATGEFASQSVAEIPCTFPIGQFAGTNTSAERVGNTMVKFISLGTPQWGKVTGYNF
jgi:hypothetical protein